MSPIQKRKNPHLSTSPESQLESNIHVSLPSRYVPTYQVLISRGPVQQCLRGGCLAAEGQGQERRCQLRLHDASPRQHPSVYQHIDWLRPPPSLPPRWDRGMFNRLVGVLQAVIMKEHVMSLSAVDRRYIEDASRAAFHCRLVAKNFQRPHASNRRTVEQRSLCRGHVSRYFPTLFFRKL